MAFIRGRTAGDGCATHDKAARLGLCHTRPGPHSPRLPQSGTVPRLTWTGCATRCSAAGGSLPFVFAGPQVYAPNRGAGFDAFEAHLSFFFLFASADPGDAVHGFFLATLDGHDVAGLDRVADAAQPRPAGADVQRACHFGFSALVFVGDNDFYGKCYRSTLFTAFAHVRFVPFREILQAFSAHRTNYGRRGKIC